MLKLLIAVHLNQFRQLFPHVNITPKQHYVVYLPIMTKQLVPVTRHSCSVFESANNYLNELERIQNFNNLPKSLAEWCQLQECSSFCDTNKGVTSHSLFSSEKDFGVITMADESAKKISDRIGITVKSTPIKHTVDTYQFFEHQSGSGIHICPYESLVDFNVLHVHEEGSGKMYVPTKYDIHNLIGQHLN